MIGIQSSLAYERVTQNLCLHLTLQTDVGMLEVTAAATEGMERGAARSNTVGVGNNDLDRLRPGEAAPNIRYLRDDSLTGKGMAHEDDEAIVSGHQVPTVGRIADVDGDSIPD